MRTEFASKLAGRAVGGAHEGGGAGIGVVVGDDDARAKDRIEWEAVEDTV